MARSAVKSSMMALLEHFCPRSSGKEVFTYCSIIMGELTLGIF
ncbi:hypothetical protein [Alteromonas pelagimontana]|nr:hypothetical protein [Alteromonas pelagimontana]